MRIPVTAFYDYVCPFCYIGKKVVERVEKAQEIDVTWKGYQLRPDGSPPPPQGYLENAWRSVRALAENYRIDIRTPKKRYSSRLALEATEFARERGRGREFHSAIFEAYFHDGEDIENNSLLLSIASDLGLDEAALSRSLDGGDMAGRVALNWTESRKYAVHGVPTYIIGDEVKVVGAQPEEILSGAILRYRLQKAYPSLVGRVPGSEIVDSSDHTSTE